jgi:hypothetical protein
MMGHIMRPSRAPAQVARLAGAQAIQPGGRRSLARVPLLLHDPRKRRVIAQRRRPRRWAILKRSEIASCLCSCACARSGTHIFPRSSLFALVSASSFASVRAWMRARACGAGGCACMGTVSLRCLCLTQIRPRQRGCRRAWRRARSRRGCCVHCRASERRSSAASDQARSSLHTRSVHLAGSRAFRARTVWVAQITARAQGWADLANYVLRCHLPLIVPGEGLCGMEVVRHGGVPVRVGPDTSVVVRQ